MTFRAHDAHIHITPVEGGGSNLDDYRRERDAHGIGMAAVVTPSTMGWDNELSFETAAIEPARFRVIARVDLLSDDAVTTTAEMMRRGASGIRVTLLGETDIRWLNDGRIDDAIAVVEANRRVVEFHVAPEQLTQVETFAIRRPNSRILIDHLGRPDVSTGVDGSAFEQFLRLAALPSIYAKTPNSSFFSAAGPPYADLAPFMERALSAFGAERLLWASDWPLCVREDAFAHAFDPLTAVLGGHSSTDADLIWRHNFERILGGYSAHD